MNILTIAQVPLVVAALWLFTAYMTRSFPTLQGKRICLLIAHPDDEAMFFAPTLLSLTKPELGNQVVVLCFSSGDADGLGDIRKNELAKSAVLLGVRSSERVVIIDDKVNFPDSMQAMWDAKLIAQTLAHYFASDQRNTTTGTGPKAMIDVLITFDEGGVSNHPNHRALYHGAKAFLKNLVSKHPGWENPVKLYTLTSTNVVRKYSTVFDAITTIVACLWQRKEKGEFPTPLVTMSSFGDYRKAQAAMTTAHKSQMRWFRWGWIGISRYMVVNDLVKQKN